MNNKKEAMLLMHHIGDSLGSTLEFTEGRMPNNFLIDIIGGGILNWKEGQATDDTELTMCILRSLSKCQKFDINDIVNNFIKWNNSLPKDIGKTIEEAFIKIQDENITFANLKGEHRKSNGSLMRCSPLALFNSSMENIESQTKITHGEFICLLSDKIYVTALKNAINGMNKENIYKIALEMSYERFELHRFMLKIKNISWKEISSGGYVVDSLVIAFWALMNFDDIENALIHVINKGRDSDTCGAITGALLGAYYGKEKIPNRWLKKIQYKDEIIALISNINF